MDVALLTAVVTSAVAMATPLLLAALGELVAERAGVINIGLEGMVLVGAFAAMVGAHLGGSASIGILLAMPAGVLLATMLAAFVVGANASQVVAGAAINLLAAGLTGVAYRGLFGLGGAARIVHGTPVVALPYLGSLPVLGPALFHQTPLGYAAFFLVPVLAFFLFRTVPGLRLRMVGENARAAEAQGIPVRGTRVAALLACGALAGAAGAYLVVAHAKTFVENMSAGRGFIALAIVVVGRRSPWGVLAAALFFGLVTALQFHLQALGLPIPYQFFLALPYLLTLVALASLRPRSQPPGALGQPYERG